MFSLFFRFITLFTPLMPVVPMNSASQPISGCGYLSSRTWTATVSGGWGRQEVDEAMCLPTTSANQNTHEQVWSCGWYPRLYFDPRKAHSASSRNKMTNKHLDTLWLIFHLLSWSLVVRRIDYRCWLCYYKLALYAYIYRLFVLFLHTANCTLPPLDSSEKVNGTSFVFSGAEDNELYAQSLKGEHIGRLQWECEHWWFSANIKWWLFSACGLLHH